MPIARAKSKHMGEDKYMGKSAGNDKCVLKLTDKKYMCTVKHIGRFTPIADRWRL